MERIVVQIYEIQTPAEADSMLSLGVDHIGSVIQEEGDWRIAEVRETTDLVRRNGGRSSLIPLFDTPEVVMRAVDYYRPDILHFCEVVTDPEEGRRLAERQALLKDRFPDLAIMRSVPIAPRAGEHGGAVLDMAAVFAPVSDYFLTDTLLTGEGGETAGQQPEKGFVGITGKTCDWTVARRLVEFTPVPVILAGGISPANAFDGIRRVRPFGVDSCTCTNAVDDAGRPIRFRKDVAKVRRLVQEVRRAESTLDDGRHS